MIIFCFTLIAKAARLLPVGFIGQSGAVVISEAIGDIQVTVIGTGAFSDMGLTSVVIPYGIVAIGFWPFAGNELTSIVIPDTVRHIGVSAFADNPLASITIDGDVNLSNYGAAQFGEPFDNDFRIFYDDNGRQALIYGKTASGDGSLREMPRRGSRLLRPLGKPIMPMPGTPYKLALKSASSAWALHCSA